METKPTKRRAVAADVDWAGTGWGAGKGSEPTTVARHQSATLSMLSCLDRLALQSNSQATARQKEIRQRDPNRFNGTYFRGCKLVFACAIKWLAPVEDVARLLVSLDFAVSLPQPEGDSEFVRRLQAVASRLQMLSVNWCFSDEGFFRGFSRRWRLTTSPCKILAVARL
jgi:hypothetical protein